MQDEHHAGRDLVRNAAALEQPSVEHSCGPGGMRASIAPVLNRQFAIGVVAAAFVGAVIARFAARPIVWSACARC